MTLVTAGGDSGDGGDGGKVVATADTGRWLLSDDEACGDVAFMRVSSKQGVMIAGITYTV